MDNYVITGFNEKYWHLWGESWLISLSKIAKHNIENIIIIGFDLPERIKEKIIATGVVLINRKTSGLIQSETLKAIAGFSKKESGIFAYWDADVYFQDNINDVFNLAKNDLIVSENCNSGFIAGTNQHWLHLNDLFNTMDFIGHKETLFQCLIANFKSSIKVLDNNIFNFTDMTLLKDIDGKLTYNEEVQKVVHPSGKIKDFLQNRNLLFWERHKDLYQDFSERKNNFKPRKLIKK